MLWRRRKALATLITTAYYIHCRTFSTSPDILRMMTEERANVIDDPWNRNATNTSPAQNITLSISPSEFQQFHRDVIMAIDSEMNTSSKTTANTIPFRTHRDFVLGGDRKILCSMAFIDTGDDGSLSGIPSSAFIIPTGEGSSSTNAERRPYTSCRRKRMGSFVGVNFMKGDEHLTWKQKLSKAADNLWQKNKVAITSSVAAGAGSAAGAAVAAVFASSKLVSSLISASVSASASMVASSVAEKAAAAARERIRKKPTSASSKASVPAESVWLGYHEIIAYF